jgi:glycerol uptake facilitator-like aquaporin
MKRDTWRAVVAEALGSALLSAAVIGSGIMAEQLANGNVAIALLANTAATVAVLVVLISLFAPISGAHFNPAVTVALAIRGQEHWSRAAAYVMAQIAGCCAGALLAHLMFSLPAWQLSTHARTGAGQWISEVVATFGLLCAVFGSSRKRETPYLVAAWIGAAYWFTASTSFANPAITIARALSDTFAGIRPADVPAFITAQVAGMLLASASAGFLFRTSRSAVSVPHPR